MCRARGWGREQDQSAGDSRGHGCGCPGGRHTAQAVPLEVSGSAGSPAELPGCCGSHPGPQGPQPAVARPTPQPGQPAAHLRCPGTALSRLSSHSISRKLQRPRAGLGYRFISVVRVRICNLSPPCSGNHLCSPA